MENHELLRKARMHLEMGQEAMAGGMGISARTLQALEGQKNPTKSYHLAAASHVVSAAKLVLEIAKITPAAGDMHRTDRMREMLIARGYTQAVASAVLGALLSGSYLRTSDTGDSFSLRSGAGDLKLHYLRVWRQEVAGRHAEAGEMKPCEVLIVGPTGVDGHLFFETVEEALPTIRELRRSEIGLRVIWPRTDTDDAIYAELARLGAVHT